MLKKFILIAVFLSFALPASAGQFKVVQVYDGDTFKVDCQGLAAKMRFLILGFRCFLQRPLCLSTTEFEIAVI